MGFLIQTHDCSNANNMMMWTHFNECLDTNSLLLYLCIIETWAKPGNSASNIEI